MPENIIPSTTDCETVAWKFGRRKKRKRKINDQQAAELYRSGMSLKAIADEIGMCDITVRSALRRAGVAMRSPGSWTKRSLRDDAFSIPTPEALYWAGFLITDGNVSLRNDDKYPPMIGLQLQSRDLPSILKFKEFVGSEHAITESRKLNKNGEWKHYVGIKFTSRRMADDLARYGVVPRKSLVATATDIAIDSVDFWRGCIDGDGSIMTEPHRTLCLVGGQRFVKQFGKFGTSVTGLPHHARRNQGKIWICRFNGQAAARLIENCWYTGCVCLDRKKVIADRLVSLYEGAGRAQFFVTNRVPPLMECAIADAKDRGESQDEVAGRFGVSPATVYNVCRRMAA